MLQACSQHSSPSWETCLLVCGPPSWLTPHIMAKSAVRNFFTLGGCCGPKRKYFSLGGCGSPEMTKLLTDRLMALVMLGIPLGGTVLYLCVKQLKAETNLVHPRRLGILLFGRLCWSQTEIGDG